MPSPFPGMDPFIEGSGYWGEFHMNMIVAMQNALNAKMPKGFAATIDVYVWIHEPSAEERAKRVKPDVFITGAKGRAKSLSATTRRKAVSQIVLPAVERRKVRSIKIEDLEQQRVVTAIELLSPSNKDGSLDHDIYMAKRAVYLGGQISLVEIDLLRGGKRMPLGETGSEAWDFYVMISRPWELPKADFWPLTLRDKLPTIDVPIVREIKPVTLNLQEAFASSYERCLYATKLNYSRDLTPRPRGDDAEWITGRLGKAVRSRRTH